ncbi:putative RNase H-like HicB family nuclease [Saccharomonospora amisosensis]|uniref:Putative RNase H-like HicB family nuclease n=1 Tax=Saccharomonospora amisosensis TaxID=1128677 RepID=A0A7X5ZP68_9PSEU|nr:hypothetical protein [Saccharomonospora amisosensis]NIJ10422.1 putative RNase H-like HicB family nuclease [Saccharomonospora amisosensis]
MEHWDPHRADPATYTVTAERQAYGWEPHIDGVGVTQTRSLTEAEDTAREYIDLALDAEDEDSFDVAIVARTGA